MADFAMPLDFRVNTRGGDLFIPAGATVHLGDDGEFAGYEVMADEAISSPTDEPPAPEPLEPSEPPPPSEPETPEPEAAPETGLAPEPAGDDSPAALTGDPAPESGGPAPTPEPAAETEPPANPSLLFDGGLHQEESHGQADDGPAQGAA